MSTLLMAPERTVVRDRGCWNCILWSGPDSELMERRVAYHLASTAAILRQYVPEQRVQEGIRRSIASLIRHRAGVCRGGVVAATGEEPDFTSYIAMCNKWTGRVRPDAPMDRLADEIRDRLGDPQPVPAPPGALIAADPEPELVETAGVPGLELRGVFVSIPQLFAEVSAEEEGFRRIAEQEEAARAAAGQSDPEVVENVPEADPPEAA